MVDRVTPNPPEVLVVGPASWNHLVRLPALPDPHPHQEFARGDHHAVGGTSAGKALHLTELGRRTLLATTVGDDADGARVEAELRRAGVDLLLERTGPTERHLNLMADDGGRLSLYLATPADPVPGALDPVVAAMAGSRALVMDLAPRARLLLDAARAAGADIWTDLHDYDGAAGFHRPFLAAARYVFCSADRLPDPVRFLHAAVDGGARVAVCTRGAAGAVAVDADHREHAVPAVPVEVVDTNGAGDGFVAGFLHATLDGADAGEALRAGARQAARALTSPNLSPLLDT